jgi:hypothetical protein
MLIFSILLHFLFFSYAFNFQRVTLVIARQFANDELPLRKYQLLLTPTWLGVIGWINSILLVLNLAMIFIYYGWLWALGYLATSQLLFGVVAGLLPFPSFEQAFDIIKKNLEAEKKTKDIARSMLFDIVHTDLIKGWPKVEHYD